MRLCNDLLAALPATVRRPAYARAPVRTGIVHFGIGAFHRAHQAVYTEDVLEAGDRDWGIVGVSLRSAGVAQQMNPQDGLFSVSVRSGTSVDWRVIGAVRGVLVAAQQGKDVLAALAAPTTQVVTLTITEKGYCRAADDTLDAALAQQGSVYPWLAQGLAQRRAQGLSGLTLLSCDNLAGNGEHLRRLLHQYLLAQDPALAEWVERHCGFPSSMVDRIVPATTAADAVLAAQALGVVDEAHVSTEPFSQWVIEDRFAGSRPRWEDHGAQLVADVRPYETAKLRLLNGAHSALAYLGLPRGHDYVHQAVNDPAIRRQVEQLMRHEAQPALTAAPGQDLSRYVDALLARFANSALNHRLAQIAMDGSQKIPQRWLGTLLHHQQVGRQCPAMLTALAAWLWHVRGDQRPVDDPRATVLRDAWQRLGRDGILGGLFGEGGLVSAQWTPTEQDVVFVRQALVDLERDNR